MNKENIREIAEAAFKARFGDVKVVRINVKPRFDNDPVVDVNIIENPGVENSQFSVPEERNFAPPKAVRISRHQENRKSPCKVFGRLSTARNRTSRSEACSRRRRTARSRHQQSGRFPAEEARQDASAKTPPAVGQT